MIAPITRKLNKTEVSGMATTAIKQMIADVELKKQSLANRPKAELDAFNSNVKIGTAVLAERVRNQ